MTHCGCKVKIEKNLSGYMKIPEIIYCPLHLASAELLELAKRVIRADQEGTIRCHTIVEMSKDLVSRITRKDTP